MRISETNAIFCRPVAHRGLWGGDIVENSITAYQNAIDNGYPIEIDLYSTTDGEIVCFHDKTLKRMTGKDGFVYEKTFAELKSYSLNGTAEKIPAFSEVLSLCENKTPLLIEFKNQPNNDYVEKAVEMLKNYKGEFAVQSFNPKIINKIKKLAPEFIRGVLATNDLEDTKSENPFTRFVLKKMPFNFIIKPDFISYKYTGLPLPKRKTKNKAVLCWTVTSQSLFDKVKPFTDNIIFENFIPKL